MGGQDEKTPGSQFAVKIDIHKAGRPGVAPEAEITKLTVWLADTSKEQGVCMNYPKGKKATRDYDFRIRPTAGWTVKEEGQRAEAAKPTPQSLVVLNCYDYGGWTALMAEADLADGRHLVGRVKGGARSTQLAIPKDDNHDHIADAWEEDWGSAPDATADTENRPVGNGVEGDGLSLYEEYRGFRCKKVHTRTDPIHKDLFVYDPNNLGIGLFAVSGITVRLVDEDEFDQEPTSTANPNVINCNRGYAALGPQHLLYLRNNPDLRPGVTGLAECRASNGELEQGLPKDCAYVNVNKAACNGRGVDGVASTIAHELAHACNVAHHGGKDYDAYDVEYLQTDGTWKGYVSEATIAVPKGQESGVEECIMRYYSASYYENVDGNYRWYKTPKLKGKSREEEDLIRGLPYPGLRVPRALFCGQQAGTGINAGPLASSMGDAAKGDCLHQFQVNDLK
jgi:hypothetical protein